MPTLRPTRQKPGFPFQKLGARSTCLSLTTGASESASSNRPSSTSSTPALLPARHPRRGDVLRLTSCGRNLGDHRGGPGAPALSRHGVAPESVVSVNCLRRRRPCGRLRCPSARDRMQARGSAWVGGASRLSLADPHLRRRSARSQVCRSPNRASLPDREVPSDHGRQCGRPVEGSPRRLMAPPGGWHSPPIIARAVAPLVAPSGAIDNRDSEHRSPSKAVPAAVAVSEKTGSGPSYRERSAEFP